MKYLDAIGREIPDEVLESFLNANDGEFVADEEKGEAIFVPDGYYVRPGCLPEPHDC